MLNIQMLRETPRGAFGLGHEDPAAATLQTVF